MKGTMDHATTPGSTAQHTETSPGQPYFPAAEWEFFRQDDKTAAKYIVGLMVGIFIVGLFLYIGVALWVSSRYVS
jgi:hypothetical protein